MKREFFNGSAYPVSKIRTLLEARFGAKNFRITRTGAIHVYAIAPNTGRVMWWFWGHVGSADTELRLDELAAEYGEEEAA